MAESGIDELCLLVGSSLNMDSNKENASLATLPNEILEKILEEGGLANSDLAHLAATSGLYYKVATSVLYKKHVREEYGVAILWAISNQSLRTLELLVENGADVNDETPSTTMDLTLQQYPWVQGLSDSIIDREKTPTDEISTDDMPFLRWFAGNVATRTYQWVFPPLAFAAAEGATAAAAWLLDHGARVDTLSSGLCDCCNRLHLGDGMWRNLTPRQFMAAAPLRARWTPLHLAIRYGHSATAVLLVDRGASLHQLCGAVDGPCTALHSAAVHGQHAVVDHILQGELMPVDARGIGGMTLLHLAYCLRDMPLVNMARMYGAYLGHECDIDGNKWTAFAMACAGNDMDFALQLLKWGATPYFRVVRVDTGGDRQVFTPAVFLKMHRQSAVKKRVREGIRVKGEDERKIQDVKDEMYRIGQDQKLARLEHYVWEV